MKRLVPVLIFLFGFQSLLFAQEKVRSVHFQGKTYFVYPYKYSKEYIYSYSYETIPGASEGENEVVPYPGQLPDGDYLMYYAPTSKYKKKMWFFKRRGEYYFDTTMVAATFHLSAGQKEGEAVFYDGYSNITEKGKYVRNVKEGFWMRQAYKDISSHTMDMGTRFEKYRGAYASVLEALEYKNGIREGKYRSFIFPDGHYWTMNDGDTSGMKLVGAGHYRLNAVHGDWRFYYVNDQLAARYSLVDSTGLPILQDVSDFYSYGKKAGFYHGWYEVFYPNGQLLTRKFYQYGKPALRDTGYYHDGKINWKYTVKEEKEKDSVHVLVDYFHYDTLGNLETHTLTKNGLRLFSRNYDQGKILCSESFDIDYYKWKNPDTLLPISIYYNCYDDSNRTEIDEISFKHPETGLVLKRNFYYTDYSYYDEMDDFEFKSDTASHIYYVTEINYRGENKEIEIRTYKHLYRSPYYLYNESYTTETDSVLFIVDGKRYSGKYKELFGMWKKKSGKIKVKEDEVKIFSYYYGGRSYGGTPTFGYSSKRLMIDYRYVRRGIHLRRKIMSTYSGSYENGMVQGKWTDRERRKGRINEISHFSKGKLHGETKMYEYEWADKWSSCREIIDPKITKKKRLSRKGRYFLSESENYENGDYHGMVTGYYCNGRISNKQEFQNGIREGIYEMYNEEGFMTKKAFYKNGYHDGKYMEWTVNRKERYNINFEEGVLVGEYKSYHYNGAPFYFGNLDNGYKIGEWMTYFEEGNIKYKDIYTMEDSSYYNFSSTYYGGGAKAPENSSHNLNSCYSMQYYPNGQLAAEGRIKRTSRTGLWKFYDEGGNLVRQINYEYGKLPQLNENGKTDTIHHYGYYESWYSDGKKQAEGYVLKESTKFDCYQEVNISMQDLFYLNYWDKENNQTIKDKTGRLKSYHLTTGKMESEGELVNGKKTGYWRYWDPEGKLTSVGNYKNDLHEGRWLFGDLEGMHYLDDACFDISDPRVMEDMELKKKQLSISEIIYVKDKVIKENRFSVNLND